MAWCEQGCVARVAWRGVACVVRQLNDALLVQQNSRALVFSTKIMLHCEFLCKRSFLGTPSADRDPSLLEGEARSR